MGSFTQDLRYALRRLTVNPGVTLVIVLTLALAIGAVTPTFSFVDAYLLRPLPFSDPDRLVHLWATDQRKGWTTLRVAYPDYRDWRDENNSFEDLAVFNYTEEDLTGGSEPESISAAQVSANLFSTLGVPAARGRTFLAGEDRPGSADVVILSHQFWQNRMGGDPRALDQALEVNQKPYQIVGVMSPEFVFPLPTTQFWIPRQLDDARYSRDQPFLQVVGRLKPGVNSARAEEDLNIVARQLAQQFPESNTGRGVNIVPLRAALNFAHDIFQVMAVVLAVANLFVLLIACSNVSSLLLGRSMKRSLEVAIRSAIGASRGRLIRQFLAESLVLALLSGGLGLLIAIWLVEALAQTVPDQLYRVGQLEIDGAALLFTLGLSASTSLIFGLLPAFRFARIDAGATLKEGAGGMTASRRNIRLQKLLVGAEVGIALMLLVGTSMMVQTFFQLRLVDPGFRSENVLTLKLNLPDSKYADPQVRARFHEQLVDEVKQLPGVVSAATVNYLPLNHETSLPGYSIPGQPPDPDGTVPTASMLSISADYFNVLQIPLLEGHLFGSEDHREAAPTVIINRRLAERLRQAGSNVLDSLIQIEGYSRPHRIVGVVGTTLHRDLAEAPRAQVYVHQLQQPRSYFRLATRTAAEPLDSLAAVRNVILRLDPDLPVTEVRSMEQVVSEFLLPQRSVVVVLGLLSAGALLLAAVGIYGLMSFFVSQRRREMGIRIALGAGRSEVIRMILRQGLTPTLVGLGAGILGAFALTQLVANQMFGAGSSGVAALLAMPLLLLALTLLSCYLPARRAAKMDPASTLRYE